MSLDLKERKKLETPSISYVSIYNTLFIVSFCLSPSMRSTWRPTWSVLMTTSSYTTVGMEKLPAWAASVAPRSPHPSCLVATSCSFASSLITLCRRKDSRLHTLQVRINAVATVLKKNRDSSKTFMF